MGKLYKEKSLPSSKTIDGKETKFKFVEFSIRRCSLNTPNSGVSLFIPKSWNMHEFNKHRKY